jgi:hypothetical protein
LTLIVGGERLQTDQVSSVQWSGDLHLESALPGRTAVRNGAVSGSVRRIGLKNGDRVTVVGLKGWDGRLIPQRVHGGDRSSLLKELGRDVWVAYLSGIAFILVGLIVLFAHIKAHAG